MSRTHRFASGPISRRNVLQIGGAGIAGLALAACGRDEREKPAEGAAKGAVTIALPLSTAADKEFYAKQFAAFTADSGVKVDFLHFPDAQYEESIQGLFRGGDVPDVFRMIKPSANMVASHGNDWIQPLDDYAAITTLLAETYGDSALDPTSSGLHIEGSLYGVPGPSSLQWDSPRLLMVNEALFDEYGVDLPETWSELREAAARITTDSGGDVYGFAPMGTGNLLAQITLSPLVSAAGSVRTLGGTIPIDYRTGKAAAASRSMVESVALLRGLVEDKSVVTGWQNFEAPALWQSWASGRVAMAAVAPWWSEEILKINPKVSTRAMLMPVPDSGRAGYANLAKNWSPQWGLTAKSRNPKAAADLMAFLGSLDLQRDYYEASRLPAALAAEYEDALTDNARRFIEVGGESQRLGPAPDVRDERANAAIQKIQAGAPSPGWIKLLFSAVDEGIDYESAAAKLDESTDTLIASVLDELGLPGDLFAFPDWDPLKDYTTEPGS